MSADQARIELPEDIYYINALMLQAIKGIEDVLGERGVHAVLRASDLARFIDNYPPNDEGRDVLAREYAQLNAAVEEFTGRAGKGMLKRIGRASFRWAIKEQKGLMGLANLALKALPTKLRMQAVLLGLRKGLMSTIDYAKIDVKNEDGNLVYIHHTNPITHLRTSNQPICHLYIGTLMEAMTYATGKTEDAFHIVETHCRATGAPYCRFVINLIE